MTTRSPRLLAAGLAIFLLASAGPAQAAPPKSASTTDPTGDVSYQPVEGFTPVGPPAWADVVSTTVKASRSGVLSVTVTMADLPDDVSSRDLPIGIFGIRGTVRFPGGKTRELRAWVENDSSRTASVGSRQCRSSGTISGPANTVTMEIRLGRCARGSTRLTAVGTGTVKGTKAGASEDEGTYLTPVYFDETAPMTIKTPTRR